MDGLTGQKWALEKSHLSLSCSPSIPPSFPSLVLTQTFKASPEPFLQHKASEKIHESSWLHFRDFEELLHISGLTEMLRYSSLGICLSTKTSTLFPSAAVWRLRKWEIRTQYLFFDYCGLYIKVLLAFTALLTAACNCLTLAHSAFLPAVIVWTSLLPAPVRW